MRYRDIVTPCGSRRLVTRRRNKAIHDQTADGRSKIRAATFCAVNCRIVVGTTLKSQNSLISSARYLERQGLKRLP